MTKQFLLDLLERVVATYVGAVLTFVVADLANVLSLGLWKSAALAAIPAAISVVKGALAKLVGDKDSASLAR